jgi:hypothetical protein
MGTATADALRGWALYLAAMGWPVFPLTAGAKKPPLVREWETRATTDTDRITRCWQAGAWNIGVATGPARLVVIDLDTGHTEAEQDGATTLAELANARGVDMPETYTVDTPSGGRHLYFTAPAGVHLRNTGRALGTGIDSRAEGGYVAGPGSLTPAGGYELADDRDPAELPGWLLQALLDRPTATPAGEARSIGKPDAYTETAIRAETERIRHAPGGQHNAELSRAAYNLGQLVGAGLLPVSLARYELHDAAAALITADCGCTRREITRVIEAGLSKGATRPRGIGGAAGPAAA